MRISTIKYLIISLVALLLYSCSASRMAEKRYRDGVYNALGLERQRKDNFSLYKEVASWLGTPHREGGLSRNGIDCSGLVFNVYKSVYHKTLERNSAAQYKNNCDRIGKWRLREGDLVFFNTTLRGSRINHVGIYLKDHKFIHTSTSRGVMVSSLDEDFFQKAWVCGGRVKYYK